MKKLTYTLEQNSIAAFENCSDYVNALPLSANVAKQFTKPAGARFVRLSAGSLFYYAEDRTAIIATADVTNGGASVSVPSTVQPFFSVTDVNYISVIAPQSCVVSAQWWE